MASNKEKVIDILSNLANDKKFGNIQIGLFGSYARNEQSNNSDIDDVLKKISESLAPLPSSGEGLG
jgi:predicted nucleotidyltransferase